VWEKYKPTKVEVREKIQKPVEKAVESVVEKVKVHKDSELEPAAAVPEPMELPVVEPVEVEVQVEEEPKEDLVKVEQSYEKPLTSEEAISILQALKGQKEPE
jgi:hypothetical protein